jgi:hypothetical protein
MRNLNAYLIERLIEDSYVIFQSESKTNNVTLMSCFEVPGPRQLFAFTSDGQIVQNGFKLQSFSTSTKMVDQQSANTTDSQWSMDHVNKGQKVKIVRSGSQLCLAWKAKERQVALVDCGSKLGNVWFLRPYQSEQELEVY